MFQILDKQDFKPKGLLRGVESYDWRLDFQGAGGCAFAGSGTSAAENFDYILDVGTGDMMMVLRSESAGGGYIINGTGVIGMLEWRTIFPRMSLTGQVPELLNQIINGNMRGLPFVPAAFQSPGGQYLDTTAIGGTLLGKLHQWSTQRLDVGYRAVHDTSTPGCVARVELYPERDRTLPGDMVLLSNRLGTMSLLDTVDDISEYRTKAFVAGEGEGDERVFSVTPDPPPGTPLIELYMDARNTSRPENQSLADYQAALIADGIDRLSELQRETRYTLEVTNDPFGLMVGDKVRLHLQLPGGRDITGAARISSIKYSGGGIAGELKEVTVGTQIWGYVPARRQL